MEFLESETDFPTQKKRKLLDRVLSFIESRSISDRFLLKGALLVFFISLGIYLFEVNNAHLVLVPQTGGSLTEGVIGTPRFINPLLAVTTADKDMSELIYQGLMKVGPDGALIPDMAESVTVSPDGLTYNIVLRDNVYFHDGVKVTTDDVVFTIERAQNPSLKSPLLASWEGITVERVNERELNLVLPKSYSPFLENLTMGILPKHIWESAGTEEFPFSQYNSEPIGSGPYKIERIMRSRSGIPESYVLSAFNGYSSLPIRIKTLTLRFFGSEDSLVEALKNRTIDSAAGISPEKAEELEAVLPDHTIYTAPLPRTFAVFFNQNEAAVFRDTAVRKALDEAVDRDAILETVLQNYGQEITGPLPPGFGFENTESGTTSPLERIEKAKDILRAGGWKLDETTHTWKKDIDKQSVELSFSIATANTPLFEETADLLEKQWEELGAVVEVKKFEQADLTQSIIRPRKFDALLFGTAVGRELDFYSFWHSSQRNDPGLNVSLYANIDTDSLLSEARSTPERTTQLSLYEKFATEIEKDTPAIFLFTPSLIYIAPKSIENIHLTSITEPSERFAAIDTWYIEKESVWPIFQNKNQ